MESQELDELIADRMVEVLNSALEADREAIQKVVLGDHVPCNEALADHPSIQVGSGGVRTLGLINGFSGTYPDGYGRIGAIVEKRCPEHGAIDIPSQMVCASCGSEGEFLLVRFERVPAEEHNG